MVREQKLAAKQGRAVGEVSTPFAAKLAGPQGMETQSQLAGIYPKSNIASSARRTQETLLRLSDDWKANIPANPKNYADIAAQKEAQKKALAQQIASATGRNARLIEGSLDRQTRGALSNTDIALYVYQSKSVHINGFTEVASAVLNVESTTKGFLPPRMTTAQKNLIATPATGLQVHDTDLNRPCFYNGTSWVTL
jgi:hypothetical protein